MSHNHQATLQFAYDASSLGGYKSSPLSSRRNTGPNPRDFLKTTSLPPLQISTITPNMPARGHKAHRNHLQSYYDPSRALVSVLRLRQTLLHLNVIEYIETAPLQPARGAPLSTANIHPSSGTVSCLSDVAQWVYLYGLLPMQQKFHEINPSLRMYQWFSPESTADDKDLDRRLLRTYHWNTVDMVDVNGVAEHPAPAMIAFVQEPWVLSERDFTNFVRTKSMPQAPRQLTGKERLWAKIYDECTQANCRWFVVTTYYQWTFGVFSEGFQAVFVALDIPSPKPYVPFVTPLQTLYYWLSSCMELPEAFVPTQMMESIRSSGIPRRSQQYHQHTRNSELRPSAVFQHSESEASSDSDDDEYKSTYSRHAHSPKSESTFQTTGEVHLSPTAREFLRNAHLPAEQRVRGPKFPIAGDQLTKEATLPRRYWRSEETADGIVAARTELQRNGAKYNTLDWLDESEWDSWESGGPFGAPASVDGITSTMRGVNLRERWVNTTDGAPPSPTLSAVSRDGSMVAGKRGGAIGKAQFAVAPKHPRRTFAYQA